MTPRTIKLAATLSIPIALMAGKDDDHFRPQTSAEASASRTATIGESAPQFLSSGEHRPHASAPTSPASVIPSRKRPASNSPLASFSGSSQIPSERSAGTDPERSIPRPTSPSPKQEQTITPGSVPSDDGHSQNRNTVSSAIQSPTFIATDPSTVGNRFVSHGQLVEVTGSELTSDDATLHIQLTDLPPSASYSDFYKKPGFTFEEEMFRAKWGWEAFDRLQKTAAQEASLPR